MNPSDTVGKTFDVRKSSTELNIFFSERQCDLYVYSNDKIFIVERYCQKLIDPKRAKLRSYGKNCLGSGFLQLFCPLYTDTIYT